MTQYKKERVAIYDIDGSLAQSKPLERVYNQGHYKRASQYMAGLKPYNNIVEKLRRDKEEGCMIVILTSRVSTERAYNTTVAWLRRHKIPFDSLEMRPMWQKSLPYKAQAIFELFSHYEIAHVVDDDEHILAFCRRMEINAVDARTIRKGLTKS